MSNQWLEDLRRKMEDHTEDVPEGLWDDIKDELFRDEEKNILPITGGNNLQGKNRAGTQIGNRPLLYRIVGVAAAIALLIIGGKQFFKFNDNQSSQAIAHTKQKVENKPADHLIGQEEFKAEEIKNNDANIRKYGFNSEIFRNISPQNTLTKIIYTGNSPETTTREKIESQQEENKADLLEPHIQIGQEENIVNNQQLLEEVKKDEFYSKDENIFQDKPQLAEAKTAKKQQKKWMLSMLTGNASTGSAEQFPGYTTISGTPLHVDDVFQTAGAEGNPLINIFLANQDKEVEARIRHKVPVTFGLSLYHNLGKKWGIGTGVNYTKLSSELNTGSASNFIKADQSVHYIGIPVQVNYNVIQKGKFTGYVTGGGLVEKAVAGEIKTKYIVNDEVKKETSEKLQDKPVQFSVNTAAGVQFRVIKNLGIYAEPGIGCHFKNNSQLNTIYKDKPLNFNMKFGVRILID